MPDGTKSLICPARLVDPDDIDLVRTWYRHYRNGTLPVAGGLLDQSNYYIEAMAYIQSLTNG